ncbi:MAG: PRK06851 family protein [Mahellales bacterium]
MLPGKAVHYFPGGNTAEGFYSFFNDILRDMKRIFIIKGGPGTGKSTFIKKIGQEMIDKGYDIELLCCSGDTQSFDGVVIRKPGIAIVDGTAPHIIDPTYPGVVDELINFGDIWDEDKLIQHGPKIIHITSAIKERYGNAYFYLRNAKAVYEVIKELYIRGMDFERVHDITDNIIGEVFPKSLNKNSKARHMFARAITHNGIISYCNELLAGVEKLYVLKGGAGIGKSTIIQRMANKAMDNGYDIQYYHCAFNPKTLDMIILPELNVALADGEYSHEVGILDGTKYIEIDLLSCMDSEIYKNNKDKIRWLRQSFQILIEEAISELYQAKKLHDDIEAYYIDAMDFESLNSLNSKVLYKINKYLNDIN